MGAGERRNQEEMGSGVAQAGGPRPRPHWEIAPTKKANRTSSAFGHDGVAENAMQTESGFRARPRRPIAARRPARRQISVSCPPRVYKYASSSGARGLPRTARVPLRDSLLASATLLLRRPLGARFLPGSGDGSALLSSPRTRARAAHRPAQPAGRRGPARLRRAGVRAAQLRAHRAPRPIRA